MFLVDAAHQRSGWRQNLVYEDEDGLLGRKLDALADDIHELADGKVGRDEILLLVDGRDVALLNLLTDDLKRDGISRVMQQHGRRGSETSIKQATTEAVNQLNKVGAVIAEQ